MSSTTGLPGWSVPKKKCCCKWSRSGFVVQGKAGDSQQRDLFMGGFFLAEKKGLGPVIQGVGQIADSTQGSGQLLKVFLAL